MMGCYTHTLAFLERIGAGDKVVRQANLRVAMARRGARRRRRRCRGAAEPAAHVVAACSDTSCCIRANAGGRCWAACACWGCTAATMRGCRTPPSPSSCKRWVSRPTGQSCFWNPIAIATLNEAPQRAAAAPFAAVLARAFFGSRRDSQFVLPGVGLSEMYTADALRFIERTRRQRRAARQRGRRWSVGRPRHGRAAARRATLVRPTPVSPPFRRARSPHCFRRAAARSGVARAARAHRLADRLGAPVARPPGARTRNSSACSTRPRSGSSTAPRCCACPQQPGQCVSAVISAAHDVAQWDNERSRPRSWRISAPCRDGGGDFAVARSVVVKEKHATMSTTPATDRLRPPATTPIDNLFLAGDWIATGLPPTIESAVMSGDRAAGLLIERLRARPSLRRSMEAESVAPRAAAAHYRTVRPRWYHRT